MSFRNTYVIGDIQGCYDGLRRVLDKVGFSPEHDKLFAVGDLVARGEDSLNTLRFLRSLGHHFSSVLGNHDLHLLSVVNNIRKAKKADKLEPLLNAHDLPELVNWLRQFPLADRITPSHVIVHAGLYPYWSTDTLLSLSQEVSKQLLSSDYTTFLKEMYGNTPAMWSEKLNKRDRLRFTVNACTRMRFLNKDGSLEFDTKTHPSQATGSINPWFNVKNPYLKKQEQIVFGHWAALNSETNNSQFVGLDTGFVWGQQMTLLNLKTNTLVSVDA